MAYTGKTEKSTHPQVLLDVNYGMESLTKGEKDWYKEVKSKYCDVVGFPNYKYRRYSNQLEVRKKGANHDLIKRFWNIHRPMDGMYVVMWCKGVKCKVDTSSECFPKKGNS